MQYNEVKNASNINNYGDRLVKNPQSYKGKWKDLFGNNNPICLELGTGRGNFIVEMAKHHPNINYKTGSIWINILKKNNWIATNTIQQVLLHIQGYLNFKDKIRNKIPPSSFKIRDKYGKIFIKYLIMFQKAWKPEKLQEYVLKMDKLRLVNLLQP